MIGLRPRLRRVLDLAPPREKEKQKKKAMMTKREPKQKQKQEPGARSRRKQQEAIEVEGAKGILVESELQVGGGKQKDAAGGYRSRRRQRGPGRKRTARGVEGVWSEESKE